MSKITRKTDPMKSIGVLVAVGFAYEKDGTLIVSNVWQKT